MLRKNGTPTSDVTMPTGMITPGTRFSTPPRPSTAPARQSARWPADRNGDLRRRSCVRCAAPRADKADRPDEGHRQRRENADAQQRGQPQTAHVDAEAHGRSSPRRSAVSFHELIIDSGSSTANTPNRMPASHEARAGCPWSRTPAYGVSSLAMNCIIDTSALKVNTSAMPNSTTPEVATASSA